MTGGLTDEQRARLRASFKAGIGFRPDPDAFVAEAEHAASVIAALTDEEDPA